ncbi:MAG TPA: alpha-L-arabinofuranosidase C-terminal domain-containing protein [Thermoguttaceae bacterium]
MKRYLHICLILIVQSALIFAQANAETTATSGHSSLTVQVDKPGVKVSPMLYGIFFEEINHAGDGGLYAELVRNRSFEDSEKPDHWILVTGASVNAEMAIDTIDPMGENNSRSLRLKIESGDGRVGVANNGFWGIGLMKDAEYDLSVALRGGDGFSGPVVVTLESADGKAVYAKSQIDNVAPQWKTYKISLTSNATDPKARLVLSASQSGSLWLDMVSLFPRKTFKVRPNGMRQDLAEMLVNIHPAFVRFPGGCWVEGEILDHAMRWKLTIGDLAQRRNQWNLWGYFSPNGLGFHEYLQFCEDLGAEPLFVINCGMSHQGNVPMDKMDQWVQDALDAIEYANGPTDGKWGSVRTKAGHPAPFNLKYMEIGNENGGPPYFERYALFYDAIKAKYPEMNLIADQWNKKLAKRPIEILDEHYYSSPEFFIVNANKYDSYDRKAHKIYVGEYAVTQQVGQGNLRAAVAEAAFMTGMERNSDVVVMSSYAPLFVNVNDRKWNPDLIGFDSSRVCGTPSYYVQKLFSENRADMVLPVKIESPGRPQPLELSQGAIGLGSWNTQVEYKDIKVTKDDQTLYTSDFIKGSEGWKFIHGKWQVKDGALQQTSQQNDCLAIFGDPSWTDYTMTVKARKLDGNEGFFIIFHVKDKDNRIWWNLGGWGNTKHVIETRIRGGSGTHGNEVYDQIQTDRWYDIRIELKGQNIRCYLDGKLIQDINPPILNSLYSVAGLTKNGNETILKVVNVSYDELETTIHLIGVNKIEPTATAIVLASANPTDENTLENPTKVVPVTQSITDAGKDFKHKFPANSVTILRLKIK